MRLSAHLFFFYYYFWCGFVSGSRSCDRDKTTTPLLVFLIAASAAMMKLSIASRSYIIMTSHFVAAQNGILYPFIFFKVSLSRFHILMLM